MAVMQPCAKLKTNEDFRFSINRKLCFTVSLQVFPTYHIYPSNPPNVAYMQPKANAPSFFMADELRQVRCSRPLYAVSTPHPHPFWRKCLMPLPFCPPSPIPPPSQELINRHLITMVHIDHSENPGKISSGVD